MKKDNINPDHYKSRSIECILFTRQLHFTTGNAFKYAWRLGMKDSEEQEINKIKWYMKDYYNNNKETNLQQDTYFENRIIFLLETLTAIENEFPKNTYLLLRSILIAELNEFDEFYLKYINISIDI